MLQSYSYRMSQVENQYRTKLEGQTRRTLPEESEKQPWWVKASLHLNVLRSHNKNRLWKLRLKRKERIRAQFWSLNPLKRSPLTRLPKRHSKFASWRRFQDLLRPHILIKFSVMAVQRNNLRLWELFCLQSTPNWFYLREDLLSFRTQIPPYLDAHALEATARKSTVCA